MDIINESDFNDKDVINDFDKISYQDQDIISLIKPSLVNGDLTHPYIDFTQSDRDQLNQSQNGNRDSVMIDEQMLGELNDSQQSYEMNEQKQNVPEAIYDNIHKQPYNTTTINNHISIQQSDQLSNNQSNKKYNQETNTVNNPNYIIGFNNHIQNQLNETNQINKSQDKQTYNTYDHSDLSDINYNQYLVRSQNLSQIWEKDIMDYNQYKQSISDQMSIIDNLIKLEIDEKENKFQSKNQPQISQSKNKKHHKSLKRDKKKKDKKDQKDKDLSKIENTNVTDTLNQNLGHQQKRQKKELIQNINNEYFIVQRSKKDANNLDKIQIEEEYRFLNQKKDHSRDQKKKQSISKSYVKARENQKRAKNNHHSNKTKNIQDQINKSQDSVQAKFNLTTVIDETQNQQIENALYDKNQNYLIQSKKKQKHHNKTKIKQKSNHKKIGTLLKKSRETKKKQKHFSDLKKKNDRKQKASYPQILQENIFEEKLQNASNSKKHYQNSNSSQKNLNHFLNISDDLNVNEKQLNLYKYTINQSNNIVYEQHDIKQDQVQEKFYQGQNIEQGQDIEEGSLTMENKQDQIQRDVQMRFDVQNKSENTLDQRQKLKNEDDKYDQIVNNSLEDLQSDYLNIIQNITAIEQNAQIKDEINHQIQVMISDFDEKQIQLYNEMTNDSLSQIQINDQILQQNNNNQDIQMLEKQQSNNRDNVKLNFYSQQEYEKIISKSLQELQQNYQNVLKNITNIDLNDNNKQSINGQISELRSDFDIRQIQSYEPYNLFDEKSSLYKQTQDNKIDELILPPPKLDQLVQISMQNASDQLQNQQNQNLDQQPQIQEILEKNKSTLQNVQSDIESYIIMGELQNIQDESSSRNENQTRDQISQDLNQSQITFQEQPSNQSYKNNNQNISSNDVYQQPIQITQIPDVQQSFQSLGDQIYDQKLAIQEKDLSLSQYALQNLDQNSEKFGEQVNNLEFNDGLITDIPAVEKTQQQQHGNHIQWNLQFNESQIDIQLVNQKEKPHQYLNIDTSRIDKKFIQINSLEQLYTLRNKQGQLLEDSIQKPQIEQQKQHLFQQMKQQNYFDQIKIIQNQRKKQEQIIQEQKYLNQSQLNENQIRNLEIMVLNKYFIQQQPKNRDVRQLSNDINLSFQNFKY